MTSTEPVPLTATPKEGQTVLHDGKTYKTIREGLAYILIPPDAKTSQAPSKPKTLEDGNQPQSVFYNPIQQFNRDLSVLAIKAFGEDLCARRQAIYEKNYARLAQKYERKNDRKRKRQEEAESGSKLQKLTEDVKEEGVDDGSVSLAENQSSLGSLDKALLASDAPEHTQAEERNGEPEQKKRTTPFRVLDALSATGLRALRYAKEIPFITTVTANDLSPAAVRSIGMHVQHNDVVAKIQPNTGNAVAHMYIAAHSIGQLHGPQHTPVKYDVIDLDPYGTAVPFLDAAVQALNDGGLLCVTCTDSAVFAGSGYPEKTYSCYGGLPAKGPHSHETGLRLITHAVATAAAKYGIAIEPLLSLNIDYYTRLFIRVRKSPAEVKFLSGKTMIVHECDSGCGSWTTQTLGRNTKKFGPGDQVYWKHTLGQSPTADRHCEHCGSRTHIAGPMWAGPLHHPAFVAKVLKAAETADKDVYGTTQRMEGMLSMALEEVIDIEYVAEDGDIPKMAPELLDCQPFFMTPSLLAKRLHAIAPPEAALKGALRHAGYRASRSHCKPASLKTNAPWPAIWHIMREWVRQKSPVKPERHVPGSISWNIMGLGKTHQPNGTGDSAAKPSEASIGETSKKWEDGEEATFEVVFDEALGRDKPGKKLTRYQMNPRENWGPMSRAR